MNHPKTLRWSLGLLTLLYLALPLLIFFVGWLQPGYALLSAVPVLFCLQHLARVWPAETAPFRPGEIGFVAAFSLALTAFAGIGGLAPQSTDWIKHNAVLFDLVNLPWPVVLPDGPDRWPLVYYLACYLPAAVAGKLAGYAAAQAVLWLWTSLGVTLACLGFARLARLPARIAAPAFFLFAGLVFAANPLVQILGLTNHHDRLTFYPNESWTWIWQFPSHYWMLEWAPGQALAGWLSAGLFLGAPPALRPAVLVFLIVCDLLWSPFAAIGLCLLAFFLWWRAGWERLVKPSVLFLGLIFPLGMLAAFYAAKISPERGGPVPQNPHHLVLCLSGAPGPLKSVILLLLFVGFEFGLYLWFIRTRFPRGGAERNLADACGLALLCLLPMTVGCFNDLSMRACTVPWFGLALLTARALAGPGLSPRLRRWFWVVILIGALTPLIEAAHQGYHLVTRRYDPRVVPHETPALVHMADGGFNDFGAQYVGSTNSFFTRHLAR